MSANAKKLLHELLGGSISQSAEAAQVKRVMADAAAESAAESAAAKPAAKPEAPVPKPTIAAAWAKLSK